MDNYSERSTPYLRAGCAALGFACATAAGGAHAQASVAIPDAGTQPGIRREEIRGRVMDDSGRAVAAGTVVVTRGPDRLVRQTTTDSAGRWSVRFEEGTGDYLVAASAPGFRSARRRVQRQGSERELLADFRLVRGVATLAGVRVRGARAERATNVESSMSPAPGVSEHYTEGVYGQLPPSVAGDLAAAAATVPGVTLTPGGVTVLGSGPTSTLTTLNGLAFPGAVIPRAAHVDTRVTAATFDPTRGGFAGANIDVRLGPGSRDYQQRTAYTNVSAPALQAGTDVVGRALGVRDANVRASVGLDGELVRRVLTYNVAFDVSRTTSDPSTLIDAAPAALARFGIVPDSASRLLAAAPPVGLALQTDGIPGLRRRDAVTWLGRLDDTRDSLSVRTLTTYVGSTREGAFGFGPLAAPSAGGERRSHALATQLVVGTYTGPGRRVWNETRLSVNALRTAVQPYWLLPGATVLVPSAPSDGSDFTLGDVTGLTLGGGTSIESDERRWTVEAANETGWNVGGRRHRFRALAWARSDGLRETAVSNRLGTFTYGSVADFAAGRPASFTRTLGQPARAGAVSNAAAAIAHTWAPTRFFSTLYGVRAEANAFASRPTSNPALQQALGVRTGVAPTRVHVSPRAGFTWTYNRARDNGNGMSSDAVGEYRRPVSGVVRGGIGEFRDLLRPNVLGDAVAGTGLASGTTRLACFGDAVPAATWGRFTADPGTVPAECARGPNEDVLAERAPSAVLIDPRYDLPRSWRASLDWNTNVGAWMWRLGGLASYDLAQAGTRDANFAGVRRFTLSAAEGARPVFVPAEAVDPVSGLVSPAAARRSAAFGQVDVRTSELRGYGGQLTAQVAPDVFKFRRNRSPLYVSLAYTLQATRRQFLGFDGANFGDPRAREWAAGPYDARHTFLLQGGFATRGAGTVTFFGRVQSGLPFTPLVFGDVDGDGRAGDRAFIPDPVRETDAALAAGIRSLAASGPAEARSCLRRYAGAVPARNGCRGPWTQTLNAQWSPPLPKRWSGRLQASVYMQNVVGGIDQLLHGAAGLRGWGGTSAPDPVLLVPRGFDATDGRFRYAVDPRFGTARGVRSLTREPFGVTLDFRLDLSTARPVQQLRRALEPVRVAGRWERRSADSVTALYLGQTSSIYRALLAESDSLFLTRSQIERLRNLGTTYEDSVRTIYVALGRYLAARPAGRFSEAELDSVAAAEKAYYRVFWRQPEAADSVLSPTQRQLFPLLNLLLSIPVRDREQGFPFFFRWSVPFVPDSATRAPGSP